MTYIPLVPTISNTVTSAVFRSACREPSMTSPTHVSFATFLYLLILTATGVALSLPNALLSALFSILPDLDTGGSRVGALLPGISRILERRFGHRTLTHSVLGNVLLGVALAPMVLVSADAWICCVAGFASHAFLDTMTVQGVRLWYPFAQSRCVFPLDVYQPGRYRTETGSRFDKGLGIIFLLGCIPTFFIAQEGYERFIRVTQRTVESAVRDYDEYSRTHSVVAEVSAHNLLTKEHLVGTFDIAGALGPHTLVFRGRDGHLHTLGNEYQSDYAVESVLCWRAKRVSILMRQLSLSNQPLGDALNELPHNYENQLFGHVRVSDRISLPESRPEFTPVTGSGQTLALNFATVDDLVALDLVGVFVESGTLTVRTIVPEDSIAPQKSNAQAATDSTTVFSRVSFDVPQGDSLVLLRNEGDTVVAGQYLARWGESIRLDASRMILEQKTVELKSELEAKEQDVSDRLARERLAMDADSVALRSVCELMAKGYASHMAWQKAKAKCLNSTLFVDRLSTARALLQGKYAAEQRSLTLRLLDIESRRRKERLRSEIRSTASGVIRSVRQNLQRGKTSVTIIIGGHRNGCP
jgi:membrane-bound metal-dependent hydrolase YbcI (DUF457 family)